MSATKKRKEEESAIPLRVYRDDELDEPENATELDPDPGPDCDPNPERDRAKAEAEEFWAGRKPAARHSARVAA